MNDSRILGQLIALLRAGLSFHQAERAAEVDHLSDKAAADYRYLREVVLASGGRAVDAFTRVRAVIEQNQEQQRRVELANASPRATVRLVLWLPIAALVLGLAAPALDRLVAAQRLRTTSFNLVADLFSRGLHFNCACD